MRGRYDEEMYGEIEGLQRREWAIENLDIRVNIMRE